MGNYRGGKMASYRKDMLKERKKRIIEEEEKKKLQKLETPVQSEIKKLQSSKKRLRRVKLIYWLVYIIVCTACLYMTYVLVSKYAPHILTDIKQGIVTTFSDNPVPGVSSDAVQSSK